MDFVNQQKNANADYLSVTIAEALIDPLKKTKKFEILPRSLADKILKEQKISPSTTFNEDTAIAIGLAADADVVVIGNFVAIEPAVQILAKAVDVGEKRLALSKARKARLDATIFDNINALAIDMTQEMAEKLPPLAQRVVVHEAAGDFIARAPVFHLYGGGALVWGNETKYLSNGFGGGGDISFQFLHRYLQPYFAANAIFASGAERVTKMTFLGADGGLAARLNFFNRKLNLTPVLGGGFQTGAIQAAYEVRYLVPSVFAGFIGDFFIGENLGVALALKQYVLIESETALKFLSLQIGVGARL